MISAHVPTSKTEAGTGVQSSATRRSRLIPKELERVNKRNKKRRKPGDLHPNVQVLRNRNMAVLCGWQPRIYTLPIKGVSK